VLPGLEAYTWAENNPKRVSGKCEDGGVSGKVVRFTASKTEGDHKKVPMNRG